MGVNLGYQQEIDFLFHILGVGLHLVNPTYTAVIIGKDRLFSNS